MFNRYWLAVVVGLTTAGFSCTAYAEPLSPQQDAMVRQALSAATLANSPPVSAAANFIANPNVPQIPSFSYAAGTPLPKAIPAALIMMMGNAKSYSPASAIQAAGGDASILKGVLSDLPFLSKLPLSSVVSANPQLANLAVKNVFPNWNIGADSVLIPKTLGQIANGALGQVPIPAEIISTTLTANLPGLADTPYGNYAGIGSAATKGLNNLITAADLPGIPDLPLSRLVSIDIIPSTMQLMKIDTVHTQQPNLSVAAGINVASGSNKEPNAPCTNNCSAVELLSAIDPNNNYNPLNGSYSLIGQKLKGGHGIVGDMMTAAGVREPAGFDVPYIGMNGCGSKWSAESPNAANGTVQQQLNLRFCYWIPFVGFQASPYFIPIPLPLPASEAQANTLLPMMIKPVVIAPVKILPNVKALVPQIAKLPTSSSTQEAPYTFIATLPSTASLIGDSTIKAWSPTLGTEIG